MHPRSRLTSRQSKPFARQRRERSALKIGLFVVVIFSWLYVFSRLSAIGVLAIGNVQVYGSDADTAIALRNAALNELDGSYLGLFARSDTLIYPRSSIASAVKAASAKVESVDVRRAGLHGLSITVTEKTPAAVVCAELPDISDGPDSDNCYFADAKGFLFEPAPAFTGEVYQRYYQPGLANDASSTSIVGSYATTTEGFNALQSFYEAAHESGIKAVGILMKDGGEYEMYAENPSQSVSSSTASHSDIAVIYFNDARPLADELSNLISFWTKQISSARAKGSTPRFDSIDVRYGSNVFYRVEK